MISPPSAGRPVRQGSFLLLRAAGILAFSLWATAHAQNPSQAARDWTLNESLKAALNSHPAILGSQSTRAAARAEREGAAWQRYPTPTVEATTPDSGGSSTLLRVDQPLWTWGRITAGIDAAGYREGAAGWAVAEARRDIALRVINAWSEVQRQQLRRVSAEEGVKAHEDLLDLMRRRVEHEVSPKVDEDFARSRLLLARNDLASVRQGLNAALSQLSLLAGTRIGRAAGSLDDAEVAASAEAALEQATGRSPTLKRLQEEVLAAGEDVRSRRATALPQVSFRVEHYMGTRPGGLPKDSRAMVVISAQPGAGLSYRSGVDAAVARQQTALLARDVAHRDLAQQIQADWEELTASRVRLANAIEAASMAGQVFDSYMRQYTAGRKTWIDVLNAIREVTQTAFGIADARAQTAAAAQRLRLLSGQIDTGSLPHAP